MKRNVIYLLLILTGILSATIRYVDINGGGQYTSIQAGINAAANSDTVLVYPGIYFENIDYINKNITVASLELTTGNPAYRDSTVIDGYHNGTCVKTSGTSALFGFTIQNGSGWVNAANRTLGGGVMIYNTISFHLSNCSIKNNSAFYGGAIAASNSNVFFKNLNIHNNHAILGGGLNFAREGSVFFNTEQRCSVYENYAGVGNDIYGEDLQNVIHLALDTLSIANPNKYYIYLYRSIPSYTGYFTYDILYGYREEVNHDLYVSATGDDSNSGLAPTQPLKTIAWALHKIASDSLNPKTIYVASGNYHTDDGQIFPLSMKDHVRLIGDEHQYPVILNRRYLAYICSNGTQNVEIFNFVFNGSSDNQSFCFSFHFAEGLVFRNILMHDVEIENGVCGMYLSKDIIWDNVRFDNVASVLSAGISGQTGKIQITYSSFNNCRTSQMQMFVLSLRDSLHMSNVSVTNYIIDSDYSIMQLGNWENYNSVMNVNNLLLTNNSTSFIGGLILKSKYRESVFANNTIVNNTAGGFSTEFSGKWQVKNNIFANHTTNEINVPATYTFSTEVDFENNLIKNYPSSISVQYPSIANFIQGNFHDSPTFTGTDVTNPQSYQLSSLSPCIDAGTADTTGLSLPAFDLFGNPRIYNGIIDIGCHEWDGTANQDNTLPINDLQLSLHPNPFTASTKISYYLPDRSEVKIQVFNVKGQLVKTLVSETKNPGTHKVVWDGTDDNGKPASSGLYYYGLSTPQGVQTKKMLLVK